MTCPPSIHFCPTTGTVAPWSTCRIAGGALAEKTEFTLPGVGPVEEERQFPPRSLSNAGLMSSIERLGRSPTVGHGKPMPYCTSSTLLPLGSRRVTRSPLFESEPYWGVGVSCQLSTFGPESA